MFFQLKHIKKQAIGRYLLLAFCLFNIHSYSQVLNDSISMRLHLNEVKIEDQKSKGTFNFYKGNALASTEEILSRMSGVNLTKRGAFGQEPGLRAYNGTQINLTINGMKMYGACTDKMDPVSIYVEPNNLKEFNVHQGNEGSSMGNSIGGLIDMKLAEPVFNCHKTLNVKWSNVYQTVNNSLNESINFHGNIKNFAYRISGVLRHADSYRSGGNQIISNSYYTKYNTSINLAYKINEKHFLKFDYIGDWGRDIGFPALSMDVGKANAGIYSLSHIYLTDLSGILQSSESRLYTNQIVHEMDDTKRKNVPIHMDMPGWSETIGCFNESKFKIKKFNIDTRIDAHKVYLRADMTMYPPNEASMYMQTLPAHELRNAGGFMNISRPVFSNQKLAIQARIDYYRLSIYNGFGADQLSAFNINVNEHINNILKSFAINWSIRLNQSWSAGMQVSTGERIASSNERLGFYLFNRFDAFDYLGNIKLKNEKSNQIEMSISFMKEKFTCNSKLFFHHNPDAIYAVALPGYSPMTYMANGVKTYTNIDFARYMGFETAFKLSIIDDIKYMGSFRYTYSTNSFNYAMPLTPPFKFQNCIQWTTNKNNIQFETDLVSAQNRVNPDFLEKKSPGFILSNFRYSRNMKIKKTDIQFMLAIENLFNKNYYEHLDIMKIARPGRNFIFGFNLSY